jgi:hypothetical protein
MSRCDCDDEAHHGAALFVSGRAESSAKRIGKLRFPRSRLRPARVFRFFDQPTERGDARLRYAKRRKTIRALRIIATKKENPKPRKSGAPTNSALPHS